MVVGEHLHFHVAGGGQVALQQHPVVAEGVARLAAGGGQGFLEAGGVVHRAHAFAAAAGHRLDQQRKADFLRLGDQGGVVGAFPVEAGQHRHAALRHVLAGGGLVAHQANGLGAGADKDQAGVRAGVGEGGVLGQKAVAGVNGVGAAVAGGADHLVDVQVAVPGRRRAQPHGAVGLAHMGRVGVDVGVHRHRGQAQLAGGADNAPGDLAPVGDQ